MMQSSAFRSAVIACLALAACRFSLDRTASPGAISGAVAAASSSGAAAPVSGADVRIEGSLIDVKTDAEGQFAIRNLPAGTYTLSLTYASGGSGQPDFVLGISSIMLPAGDGIDLGTIQLALAGSLAGQVLSSTGQVVPDAVLSVLDSSGNPMVGIPTVRSDGNGQYDIPYARAGNVSVQAVYVAPVNGVSETLVAQSQSVTVLPREQTTVDLHLSAPAAPTVGNLTGDALWTQGVQTVDITLVPDDGSAPMMQPGTNAAPFVVPDVPIGIYTLIVGATGLEPIVLPGLAVPGDTDVGTLVFTQATTAPKDCNQNGILACENGQTTGCDLDDDSDGVPDALESAGCRCEPGQILQSSTGLCLPLDPCEGIQCDPNAMCSASADGLAVCVCNSGFFGDGLTCSTQSLCATANGGCDPNATCAPSGGTVTCTCNPGFAGNGMTCASTTSITNVTTTPSTVTLNSTGFVVTFTLNDTQLDSVNVQLTNVGAISCTNTGAGPWQFTCPYSPLTGKEVTSGTKQTVGIAITTPNPAVTAAMTSITFDYRTPLQIDQSQTQLVVSPWGDPQAETVAGLTVTGQYAALMPMDELTTTSMPAATFMLSAGSVLSQLQIWADVAETQPLASVAPNGDGTWPPVLFTPFQNVQTAWVSGIDTDGNPSAPTQLQNFEVVVTPNTQSGLPGSGTVSAVTVAASTRTPPADITTPVTGTFSPGATPTVVSTAPVWHNLTPSTLVLPSTLATSEQAAYDPVHDQLLVIGTDTSGTWHMYFWNGLTWTTATDNLSSSEMAESALVFNSIAGAFQLLTSAAPGSVYQWSGTAWVALHAVGGTSMFLPGAAVASDQVQSVYGFGGTSGGTATDSFWSYGLDGYASISSTGPSARTNAAMVWDGPRSTLVLYGGVDGSGNLLTDLWEWNGSQWSSPTSTAPVPASTGMAFVYDYALQESVLYGGVSGSTQDGELWTWNGSQFHQISTDFWPGFRTGVAGSYDGAHNRVLFFGGATPSGSPTDMWSFDGTTWRIVSDGGNSPSPRFGHGLDYDVADGWTMLYGGTSDGTTPLNDVWTWYGSAWNLGTASTGPARFDHAMVYDSNRSTTVVFGGIGANGTGLSDLWEYSAFAWSNPALTRGTPTACSQFAAAYDPSRGKTVLFGGAACAGGAAVNETWEWDGTTFAQVTPSSPPPARTQAMMAYSPQDMATLLYGGFDSNGDTLSDFWMWNGTVWTELPTSGVTVPALGAAALLSDPDTLRMLLLGGLTTLTGSASSAELLYGEAGQTWSNESGPNTPAARASSPAAYDSNRQRLVQFSGKGTQALADTEEQELDPNRTPALQFDVTLPSYVTALYATGLTVRGWCAGTSSTGPGAQLGIWQAGTTNAGASWSEFLSNTATTVPSTPLRAAATPFTTSANGVVSVQCRPLGGTGTGTTEAQVSASFFDVRFGYSSVQQD